MSCLDPKNHIFMAGEILIPACVNVIILSLNLWLLNPYFFKQLCNKDVGTFSFVNTFSPFIQVDTFLIPNPIRASTNVIDTQATLWVLGFDTDWEDAKAKTGI